MKRFFVSLFNWLRELGGIKEKSFDEKISSIRLQARSALKYEDSETSQSLPRIIFAEERPTVLMINQAINDVKPNPYGIIFCCGKDNLDEKVHFADQLLDNNSSLSKIVDISRKYNDPRYEKLRLVYLKRRENEVFGSTDELIIFQPVSSQILIWVEHE